MLFVPVSVQCMMRCHAMLCDAERCFVSSRQWKGGARNTTGGDSGGRRVCHENMLLKHGPAERRNNNRSVPWGNTMLRWAILQDVKGKTDLVVGPEHRLLT